MDCVGKIVDYEGGFMNEEEIVEFFQELINSGICWELQGSYGRTANDLIEIGLCEIPAPKRGVKCF